MKKEDNDQLFYNITVGAYLKCTCRAGCFSEKAYNIHVQEFWAITFVKANGHASAIPTYIVYWLYDWWADQAHLVVQLVQDFCIYVCDNAFWLRV